MDLTDRVHRWLCVGLLLFLGWLAYAHTLDVPFYFDDYPNIVKNPAVHLSRLTPQGLHRALTDVWMRNRPLAYLSFALNFYVGGFHVAGYHLVNILLHLATGVLLFELIRTTLALDGGRSNPSHVAIAFWSALIWLVHPVQTQAVTYVIQRMTVMSAFFYLLALWCYVQGRRHAAGPGRIGWYAAAAATGLAALASKEVAITLPGFILFYEWLIFQRARGAWLRRAWLPLMAALGVLVLVVLVYTRFDPLRALAGSYRGRDFTLVERLLTQPRVVVFYIGLILLPHPDRLSLLQPISVSKGWLAPPATLISALAVALLILAGAWLVRRDRVAAFGVLWFFGQLVLESTAIGLEMIYEHRLYLPTLFLGLVLMRLLERLTRRSAVMVVFGIMGGLCWVLGFWTVDRNQVWKDPAAFWRQTVDRAPESARARSNLAGVRMRRKEFQAAAELLEQAVALDPNALSARLNLAESYARIGNDAAAAEAYRQVRQLTSDAPEVLLQVGAWHAGQGRDREAEQILEQGLARKPGHPGLLNRLGRVYLDQGRLEAAEMQFARAVAADPGYAEAYDNLGQTLFAQGRHAAALDAFRRAIRLAPANPDGYYNLAFAYERIERYAEAAAQYEQVLRLVPRDAEASYRSGFLFLVRLGATERGVRRIRRALRMAPDHELADIARGLLQGGAVAPAAVPRRSGEGSVP